MNLKKKNFNIITNIYQAVESDVKNNIWLVTHFSNLNTIENNLIKIFCDKNNIKNKYIKINLIKRLTRNNLFLNLLSGPTKIFFFSNFNDFLNFFNNFFIKKKVIPLAVYFNNNLYSYTFFYSFLKNLNELKDLKSVQEKFILSLTNRNKNGIVQFNNFLLNFIKILSLYNNTNKIK